MIFYAKFYLKNCESDKIYSMKKILYYFLYLLLFILPTSAFAHVKWFVDSDEVTEKFHDTTFFYSWTNKEVLIWSGIVFLVVLIFSFLDTFIKVPTRLLIFATKNEKTINRIAQVILGLFLISVSFLWKIIIVPDMEVSSMFTIVLQYIQAFIGLMFVFNFKPKIASIILMLFCVWITIEGGIVVLLENAILLSLAIYFFIVNSKEDSKVFTLKKHAVEIVRIGTGISLIVLAFTEKLFYPELSLAFLYVHHWNFMQSIFPWYSNQLFVLSVGFAEMIFGILFILGYITRITTILIAIFFAFSVTTMFIQFGAWEVEDLVVYSAAIIFLFFGHGRTKFMHLIWKNSSFNKKLLENK